LTPTELDAAGLISNEVCGARQGINARRKSFDAITRFLVDDPNAAVDPLVAARFRASAMLVAGVDLGGRVNPHSPPQRQPQAGAGETGKIMEVEFSAIYW
jgi:hypothetical protein